jgi:hypothetical protein
MRLPDFAAGRGPILSRTVAADPRVARLLQSRRLAPTVIPIPATVLPEGFAHRLDPIDTDASHRLANHSE